MYLCSMNFKNNKYRKETKSTALITGATGGLGQEFVKLHAGRKGDLVLVAREQEALTKLKENVEKEYSVEAYTIAVDLSQAYAAERIYNELKGKDIAVDYLLNNADFGGQGDFFTRTMEQDLSMIAVNVVSGLTFVQCIFMSMAPLLPRKMIFKSVYDMQNIKK